MNLDDMNDGQHDLLFAVRRSIRYHDRRRAFFDRMHQVTAGLTILLAGSVLFDMARPGHTPWWMTVMAFVAALLSAWDMVVGYAQKANLHGTLKNRFSTLEMAMIAGDDTPETLNKHLLERLRIEQDEPPIYRALDLLCRNELMIAMGYKKSGDQVHLFDEIGLFENLTRHILHWENISQTSTHPPVQNQVGR
ncbi:MAG: hypothetical protein KJ958_03295 [Gammaproteobacteria bacterium]|nr:hypothetical protein [Gammaproteobacteria bacterium]MBU1978174.1 hypothetical protein [Gammaproteobacteria bacterium]